MAKEKARISTEKAILEAARKVFTQKGYAAARMEDIAKKAGINRALLHYYFRTKDRMFEIIFEERFNEFFSGMASILGSSDRLDEKIRALVAHDIDMIRSHPDLPIFIMQELAQNPQRLLAYAQKAGAHPGALVKSLDAQVKKEIKGGTIRKIEASELLINIMSLSIYPFIAKPMIKAIKQFDDLQFDRMMKKRKEEIADFIISALKP